MTKTVSVVVIISLISLLSSCATIIKGNSENVNFNSDPQRAELWVNGHNMGQTPIELKLESKKTYTVEFRKEGFATVTKTITNHVGAGWVILDVIFGLVPVIVDAATGAWYSFDQKNINAILEKQQP